MDQGTPGIYKKLPHSPRKSPARSPGRGGSTPTFRSSPFGRGRGGHQFARGQEALELSARYRKKEGDYYSRAPAATDDSTATPGWRNKMKGFLGKRRYSLDPEVPLHRTPDPDWETKFKDWPDWKKHKGLKDYHKKYLQDYKQIRFGDALGAGGYGTVYRCSKDLGGGRSKDLACKVQSIGRYKYHGGLKMAVDIIVRDADNHKKLDHPHIVHREQIMHVYDVKSSFTEPIHVLIFMEAMDGALSDFTKHGMVEKRVHYWFIQIIRGLEYMHGRNIAHLDIKPENILYRSYRIGNEDQVIYKLSDFGLAQENPDPSRPGTVMGIRGTMGYTAPEIVHGQPWETKPADIWALGITLVTSLVGTHRDINHTITSANNWDASVARNYGMSMQLAQVISGMMDPDSSWRWPVERVARTDWVRRCYPDNVVQVERL